MTSSLSGKLAAITAYFNPASWATRRANYHRFVAALANSGVDLWTIEAAIGNRPFDLPPGPRTVQLRCRDALWQKERMLNLALTLLPPDVDKVAWLDCDIVFEDRNWAHNVARLLEERAIVQLFETVRFLAPNGGPAPWHDGKELLSGFVAGGGWSTGQLHPGFAWATRRALIEKHRFPDFLIAGSADAIIALSAVNKLSNLHLTRYSRLTSQRVEHWSRGFSADVDGNVGFLPGTIRHLWHGSHQNRRYLERLDALARMGFDPDKYLETGPEGLLQWSKSAPAGLCDMIEEYFRERQEDEPAAVEVPVTAVMVTGESPDRVVLARRAAWSFARQEYPHKHLVILNACPIQVLTPALLRKMGEACDVRNVREVVLPERPRLSFGQLHNAAASLAKTHVVVQWNDDCVSHPRRLTLQMAAWSGATAVVLRRGIHVGFHRMIATDAKHSVGGGLPGTVLWDKRIQAIHSSLSRGEDPVFVERLVEQGPVIAVDGSPTLYVHCGHGLHNWHRGAAIDDCGASSGRGLTCEEAEIVTRLLSDTPDLDFLGNRLP